MEDNRKDARSMSMVFSMDAETDGLWGPHFAIAVAVLDAETREVVEKFSARLEDLSVVKDEWVQEHIVPLCLSIQETYPTHRALRDAFWNFWMKYRDTAIAVADCGSSVEAGLIRLCVEDDPETRSWKVPFPLYDLGTLLLMFGHDPQQYREGESAQRATLAGLEDINLHHPGDDAYASGMCWCLMAAKAKEMRESQLKHLWF